VVKELEVSLFQAMVLLMFNDRTEWSYEQIFVSTKIGWFSIFAISKIEPNDLGQKTAPNSYT
jgi:hypothetical protein